MMPTMEPGWMVMFTSSSAVTDLRPCLKTLWTLRNSIPVPVRSPRGVAGEAASGAADVPWAIGVPSGLKGVSRQAGWWAGPASSAFSGLGFLLLEFLLGVVQALLRVIERPGECHGGGHS